MSLGSKWTPGIFFEAAYRWPSPTSQLFILFSLRLPVTELTEIWFKEPLFAVSSVHLDPKIDSPCCRWENTTLFSTRMLPCHFFEELLFDLMPLQAAEFICEDLEMIPAGYRYVYQRYLISVTTPAFLTQQWPSPNIPKIITPCHKASVLFISNFSFQVKSGVLQCRFIAHNISKKINDNASEMWGKNKRKKC